MISWYNLAVEEKELIGKMKRIFKEVLSYDLPDSYRGLVARDVPQWDSINHVRIILRIEAVFRVRFTIKEIQKLQNIGELVDAVRTKLVG